jgi:hypothetical protein
VADLDIVFSADLPKDGYTQGQRVTLDAERAKAYIKAGYAKAATVADAKAVRVDPETAASKSKGA